MSTQDELDVIYEIPQSVNDAWEKWNIDPNSTATVLHGTPEENTASLIGFAAGYANALLAAPTPASPDLQGELVAALKELLTASESGSDMEEYEARCRARAILAKLHAESDSPIKQS